ncbi:MAG: DUF5702 domain-containing protein, partial [bacterium]
MLVNGTDQALFSLLARYDRQMLEDFDVFLLDGGIGTSELHPEKLSQWAAEDLSYVADPARGLRPLLANSLFDLSVSACDLTGYTLATDAGGRIFRDAALRFEKETAAISAAAAAVNWIQSLRNLTNTQEQAFAVVSAAAAGGDFDEAANAAKKLSQKLSEAAAAAEQAQAAANAVNKLAGGSEKPAFERLSATEATAEETFVKEVFTGDSRMLVSAPTGIWDEETAEEAFAGDSPPVPYGLTESVPFLNMIVSSPILSLTLTDAQSLSWRSVRAEALFSNRRHRQGLGVLEVPESGDSITDRFLYNEYLLSHLGNRKSPQKDAALFCPVEYLIAGSTEDAKNVEGVIHRILIFREGVNVVCLLKDPIKRSLVQSAGFALALAAGHPGLEKEFSVSLAAAWAYAESLVDIRGLFLGKRNCFLKDSAHWQVELTDLSAFFSGGLDRLVKGSA